MTKRSVYIYSLDYYKYLRRSGHPASKSFSRDFIDTAYGL